jgi:hypothetical protein
VALPGRERREQLIRVEEDGRRRLVRRRSSFTVCAGAGRHTRGFISVGVVVVYLWKKREGGVHDYRVYIYSIQERKDCGRWLSILPWIGSRDGARRGEMVVSLRSSQTRVRKGRACQHMAGCGATRNMHGTWCARAQARRGDAWLVAGSNPQGEG